MSLLIGIENKIHKKRFRLGSKLKSLKNFIPQNDYGIYIQPTETFGTMNLYSPINQEGDVQVFQLRNVLGDIIRIYNAGVTLAHTISNPDIYDGTFLASNKGNYTNTIGDKVYLTFKGTFILFYSAQYSLGGLWKFNIDGGEDIYISCWRSSLSYVRQTIADGLENTEHTIVGEFMGEDPDHPVGDGNTPRGYICSDTKESGTDYQYKAFYFNDYTNLNYLQTSDNSNYDLKGTSNTGAMEFAITARKEGSEVTSRWIPEHTWTDPCTKLENSATDRILKIDDVIVDITTITGTRGLATKCNKVEYWQKVIGFNFEEPLEDLLQIVLTHTFDYRGLFIDQSITALQNVFASNFYLAMMALEHSSFNNSIINDIEIPTTATDGSNVPVLGHPVNLKHCVNTKKSTTGDAAKFIYAMQILSGSAEMNKFSEGANVFMKLTDSSVHKLYPQLGTSLHLTTGDNISLQTHLFMNLIDDAYNAVAAKLL